MIIIPAIDIKDGRCVRLRQGDFDKSTVFSDDPLAMALRWQDLGAERLHLVDLDGSRSGVPMNAAVIRRIVEALDIPVQAGGGIRDIATIEKYLAQGVRWVILGTAAVKSVDLIPRAVQQFPGRVMLGLDARDGAAAVEGWTERSALTPLEIARSYKNIDLAAIVYTDIARDGMESGVNVEATRRFAESAAHSVIASGGVAGLEDIRRLREIESSGIIGVIAGRALYTGALDLREALLLSGEKTV
ncbi:MAG: 1-(5-phosphoribosyl)-5-[(5-phosphoribosylamino)methylideneamino]imidazole-4-carboxamide isomerase [Deltaproteobacteria bacterium]|nr:1-(5-phosphoribosyl)-5-[(5-phosphoribosylamino)methylideneamino]imidazole-4-carboxamide isomerase [Deltaproteobacteria bacterium]